MYELPEPRTVLDRRLEKIDSRLEKLEGRMNYLFGGLSVIVVIANLFEILSRR